ncbi:MAG: hypothetical protein OHK0017_06270 [Patescibacteria group bacterium]
MISYIWSLVAGSASTVIYILVGRCYRSVTETYWGQAMGDDLIHGRAVKNLLSPQSFWQVEYFKALGERLSHAPVNLSGYVLSVIIASFSFVQFQGTGIKFFGVMMLFLPISFTLQFITNYIIGLTSIFPEDKRTFSRIWQSYLSLTNILTGFYIPLDKMPFNWFFEYSPYAWMMHHPMQIYLGRYSDEKIVWVFIGGLSWITVLYMFSSIIFKIAMKRNESAGL